MIDWHTHILPEMDDGSRNVAESIAMIDVQVSQGVDTVVATPHFYANDETVESFLDRRKKALELLYNEMPEKSLQIRLGAEVRYYQGISRLSDLKALRIEGTKLLLLEMPMNTWTEYMVRELIELSGKSSIRIVIAHIERYYALQKKAIWDRINECGILKQANASFFTSLATKRRAITMLNDGNIQFIGSDCHNMTSRPPKISKAFAVVEKKLGDDYVNQMNEYGYAMLSTTNI